MKMPDYAVFHFFTLFCKVEFLITIRIKRLKI